MLLITSTTVGPLMSFLKIERTTDHTIYSDEDSHEILRHPAPVKLIIRRVSVVLALIFKNREMKRIEDQKR